MTEEAREDVSKLEWIDYDVTIPTSDGTRIREKRTIKIPIYRDPDTGEEMLTEKAAALIDETKARYMHLMLPEEIRNLRLKMGLTQTEFADLLCIGAKTPSRWESGRERPSQFSNLFLRLLDERQVSAAEIRQLRDPEPEWWDIFECKPALFQSAGSVYTQGSFQLGTGIRSNAYQGSGGTSIGMCWTMIIDTQWDLDLAATKPRLAAYGLAATEPPLAA